MAKRKLLDADPVKIEPFTWTEELSFIFIKIMTNIGTDVDKGFKKKEWSFNCLISVEKIIITKIRKKLSPTL